MTVEDTLAACVREVTALRRDVKFPHAGAAPTEVQEALLDTRQRLDRVEEILSQVIGYRGAARRRLTEATASADEVWDRASVTTRGNTTLTGRDFTGPRERYADANLATLESRRAQRIVAEMSSRVDDAHDQIRLMHRGLDGVRQDLIVLLRSAQFLSSLET